MMVPPPMPNSAAERPGRRRDRGEARSREDIAGHTTAGVRSTAARSRRRCAPARRPRARGDLLRHRRHAGADRGARRGRPGARGDRRCCSAGSRAATAAWPASPGRSAAEARRLVGVGGIAYAGSHGAELLDARRGRAAQRDAGLQELGGRACRRSSPSATRPTCARCACASRTRARSSPSTGAARRTRRRPRPRCEEIAGEAEAAGSPPTGAARCSRCGRRCRSTRARPCASCSSRRRRAPRCSAATTQPTSTPSTRSTALREEGALDAAVRVGVRSDEGPPAIVERADLVVDGVDGFAGVLAALGRL